MSLHVSIQIGCVDRLGDIPLGANGRQRLGRRQAIGRNHTDEIAILHHNSLLCRRSSVKRGQLGTKRWRAQHFADQHSRPI